MWSPGSTQWCGWQAENISISLDECCENFKQQLCLEKIMYITTVCIASYTAHDRLKKLQAKLACHLCAINNSTVNT